MQKILIADRSQSFSKSLAEELSAMFDVRICQTGREALELYSTFAPDILILELELPELDGLSVFGPCGHPATMSRLWRYLVV